ncbi:MAG: DUF2235 domain-containing protein [Alphaproteobacteria bacterium]|nr:DUF2235 domain-containing protein [Alphaproteobacteria bacterium]
MTNRLVVCFDGTWNRPDKNSDLAARVETNVCRFYEAIPSGKLPGGDVQKKWYDTGVGTNWYDQITGGSCGIGIDQKIRKGYQWLTENYPDADPSDTEIFILGFSRGAYTARSLVGMIRNCGLLLPENAHRVGDAYALYRQRDESADTNQAQVFRDRYSREIKIKFLGVWDTVGALGIPLHALHWLNAKEYAFHDTELSRIVENAAHAVAIDEFRVDYQVTLWAPIIKPDQDVEQRWFSGAHADIGGGYESRLLSDITLAWMQRKAGAVGLALDNSQIPVIAKANWIHPPTDSYQQFLDGLYANTHPRFFRAMQIGDGLNEVLDESVVNRCRDSAGYRPLNPGFPAPLIS